MKKSNSIVIGFGAVGLGLYLLYYLAQNSKETEDEPTDAPNVGKIEDYKNPPAGAIDRYWGNVTPVNLTKRQVDYKDFHLSPEYFVKKFNLAGVEFGNYMNQEYRASHLAGAAQGFIDLSAILGVAPEKIGMNKKLSVAFGARGFPRTAAHYEPRLTAINMTKENGIYGSLAHEYGHFIDNIVAQKLKLNRDMAAERSVRMSVNTEAQKNAILGLYEDMFRKLYYDSDGNETEYHLRQLEFSDYYRMRSEVFARTFEVFCIIKLKAKGIENRYLQKKINQFHPDEKLVKLVMPNLAKIIKFAFS